MGPVGRMALTLALLSLLSVGGINTVLADMHRDFVTVEHWMTDTEFADFFALAQAAPGPNFIIMVASIGWHVGGLGGALAAFAAISLPSLVTVYLATRAWDRFRDASWRAILQAAMTPVAIGLLIASAVVLMQAADVDWGRLAISLVTAGAMLFTRLNPLWLMGLGALLGMTGVV